MTMDVKVLEKYLTKYPKLEVVIIAGVLSKKQVREIIDADKWQMDDMVTDLILAECIKLCSGGSFRANREVVEYIHERRKQHGQGI
jgi:hypothetical protein